MTRRKLAFINKYCYISISLVGNLVLCLNGISGSVAIVAVSIFTISGLEMVICAWPAIRGQKLLTPSDVALNV